MRCPLPSVAPWSPVPSVVDARQGIPPRSRSPIYMFTVPDPGVRHDRSSRSRWSETRTSRIRRQKDGRPVRERKGRARWFPRAFALRRAACHSGTSRIRNLRFFFLCARFFDFGDCQRNSPLIRSTHEKYGEKGPRSDATPSSPPWESPMSGLGCWLTAGLSKWLGQRAISQMVVAPRSRRSLKPIPQVSTGKDRLDVSGVRTLNWRAGFRTAVLRSLQSLGPLSRLSAEIPF